MSCLPILAMATLGALLRRSYAGRRGRWLPATGVPGHVRRQRSHLVPLLASAETVSSTPTSWTQGQAFQLVLQTNVILYIFALGLNSMGLLPASLYMLINRLFTAIFVTEVGAVLVDQGPKRYLSKAWHWIDVLLAISLVLGAFTHPAGRVDQVLRLTTGLLRISVVLEVLLRSPPVLQRVAGVAFFVAVNNELKANGIQSVVGMLGVFVVLVVLRQICGPERASMVYGSLEPAKAFLVKWATLFFVPALIKLPLLPPPPGSVLLRLAALMVIGFLGTLTSTAAIANLFPEGAGETVKAGGPPTPVAAGRPPYQKRLLAAYGVSMVGSAVAARAGWVPFATAETIYMFSGTLLGFVGGMLAPKGVRTWAHPMFVCIGVTWLCAAGWGVLAGPMAPSFKGVLANYCAWPGAGAILTGMLGPALLALGVLLFERRRMLSQELLPIFATCAASSLVTLFGTAFLSRALGLKGSIATATLTRSISTPFAADLLSMLHANQTYAIALVVLTGFVGVVVAPLLFQALGLRSPRTRGLAMGASAHGLGTVALAETDEDAFPYSALGFLVVGTATSVLLQLSPIRSALFRILLG